MGISLVDDRLYQWDSNQMVKLDGRDADEATEVHFAQFCGEAKALIVEVKDFNGMKVADIPNSFLTETKSICAWTWHADETISGERFQVIERARPSDYAYTPTEVLNFEHLRQELLDLFQEFELSAATDYEALKNKPRINNVELVGDRQLSELGMETATDQDIDGMFAV